MKKETVLGVVRHQKKDSFRFSIVGHEFKEYPLVEKVIIKGLDGVDPDGSHDEVRLYANGSIYSEQISDWIKDNKLTHNAGESYRLIKFYFDYEESSRTAIFTFVEITKHKRNSHRFSVDRVELGRENFPEKLIRYIWYNERP